MAHPKSSAFCIECGGDREYSITTSRVESEIRGVKFSYVEHTAVCIDCGEELYVPEINDSNAQAREDAYREASGLITVGEIQEVLKKYDIGAGPLSKLLGFGEVTIHRYLAGQLPSKKHSDLLLKVRASHKEMAKLLRLNGEQLSPVAYKKCKEALTLLNDLLSGNKIDMVARYFLVHACDITPLSVQKLLYYAQSFFMALYNTPLFIDRCQAWVGGPVYPNVYYKYREFGYDPMEMSLQMHDEDIDQLTNREVVFLNEIINAFGCYSGKILSRITHAEKPWMQARGNLLPTDRSVTELDQNVINDYFREVVEKYHIVNPCDIKKYSAQMCKSILQ